MYQLWRRIAAVVLLILLPSSVLSCSSSIAADSSSSEDGVKIVTGRAGDMTDEIKTFTIRGANRSGCVTAAISTLDPPKRGVLVVPDGSRVIGGTSDFEVSLDDGTVLRQGDEVKGGGVAISADDAEILSARDADTVRRAAQECSAESIVVLDNWSG